MYTVRPKAMFRDSQGKVVGLVIVVVCIGLLLTWTSFNGTGLGMRLLYRGEQKGDVFHESQSVLDKGLALGVTPHSASPNDEFYGIMFDAGSTGSRIHVFKFRHLIHGAPFEFVEELFEKLEPGLSSFADDPVKGALSLVPMLDKAKEYIPQSKWSDTPIGLKATAGLRLLRGNQAQALLDEVLKLFKNYPFKMDGNSVAIMDGLDEGIFSWFTYNYFSGTLFNVTQSIGVMDLGGGSMQVTFVPQLKDTIKSAPKDFMHEIDIFGKKSQLYTHSYLGLGLMSGRLQTLGGKEGENEKNPDSFQSPCFSRSTTTKWQYGGKTYLVGGSKTSGSRFDNCYAEVKKVIGDKIQRPAEIKDRPFCLISYYYDRAVESNIIDNSVVSRSLFVHKVGKRFIGNKNGTDSVDSGRVTLQNFFDAAAKVCQKPEERLPFLCLDLVYIVTVLHDGFGFEKSKVLGIGKRVKGQEISWALGAMFSALNSQMTPAAGG